MPLISALKTVEGDLAEVRERLAELSKRIDELNVSLNKRIDGFNLLEGLPYLR